MPHRNSNIPDNIFYSALAGEFLRISRSSLLVNDAISSSKELILRIRNQGGKDHMIKRVLNKVTTKHENVFSRYNMERLDIVQAITQ